ncbi:hypothetical protein JXB31_05105 [Candidatus Woesearchaeota archaeon]|nr:hypothetical protein [Candidatus Woesearchaeota archaeon]
MIDHEKILMFIKMNGPVLPVQLSKKFNYDTFIMGAVLSELSVAKKIMISNTKVGGSPVYYLKEQASRLQELYRYLNEKDQRTFDLLKAEKVLRDREMTPLVRVSLREIKDFAVPLAVKIGDSEELFWRWYMTAVEEATERIRSIINHGKGQIGPGYEDRPRHEEKPGDEGRHGHEERLEPKDFTHDSRKGQGIIEGNASGASGIAAEVAVKGEHQNVVPESLAEAKEKHSSQQKTLVQDSTVLQGSGTGKVQADRSSDSRSSDVRPTDGKSSDSKSSDVKPVDGKHADEEDIDEIKDRLHTKIKRFFNKKDIMIKTASIVRKNIEIDYILQVPSSVGNISYYCKVKSKNRINENDLASAYVTGQLKKMPVMFITTGSLSKKAKEKIGKEFENIKVIKVN